MYEIEPAPDNHIHQRICLALITKIYPLKLAKRDLGPAWIISILLRYFFLIFMSIKMAWILAQNLVPTARISL